jgi:hypothetical protein
LAVTYDVAVPARALDILLKRLTRRERLARAARWSFAAVWIACPLVIASGRASLIPASGVLGLLLSATRPVGRLQLAAQVDRLADLRELLGTASSIPADTVDPFERAVLTQAEAKARSIDLRAVSPPFPSGRATGATALACVVSLAVMVPLHRGISTQSENASPRTPTAQSPGHEAGWPASSQPLQPLERAESPQDPRGDAPTRFSNTASTTDAADSAVPSRSAADAAGSGQASSADGRARDRSTPSAGSTVGAQGDGRPGTAGSVAALSGAGEATGQASRQADRLDAAEMAGFPPDSHDAARVALQNGRIPPRVRGVVRAYFDLPNDP